MSYNIRDIPLPPSPGPPAVYQVEDFDPDNSQPGDPQRVENVDQNAEPGKYERREKKLRDIISSCSEKITVLHAKRRRQKLPALQHRRRRNCFWCHFPALWYCARCGVTPYCDRDCQKADWLKRHRDLCNKALRMHNVSRDDEV